jgi:hypothetical protein
VDNNLFRLTEIGAPLQSGIPGSLRSMILTLGEEHYHAWGGILHSIQSGEPAFDWVFNAPLFDHLQRSPAVAETFNHAMTDFTRQAALAIIAAYDFSAIGTAVDVGGGHGALIGTILRSNPHIMGMLFDLPSVVVKGLGHLQIAAIADRCWAVGGNFFESVPAGADVYLLKNVLHDWDDDSAIAIVNNCRRAISDVGRLLAIEVVLSDPPESPFGNLLDLNMLVMSGGGGNVPKLSTGNCSRRVAFDFQDSYQPWPQLASLKPYLSLSNPLSVPTIPNTSHALL